MPLHFIEIPGSGCADNFRVLIQIYAPQIQGREGVECFFCLRQKGEPLLFQFSGRERTGERLSGKLFRPDNGISSHTVEQKFWSESWVLTAGCPARDKESDHFPVHLEQIDNVANLIAVCERQALVHGQVDIVEPVAKIVILECRKEAKGRIPCPFEFQ
jgi:hypothetical protein